MTAFIESGEGDGPSATANHRSPHRTPRQHHAPRQHQQHQHVNVSADAPRLHGVVVSRQEKYGFIKSMDTEARYFFHLKDTDGVASHGAQVTFVVALDNAAGKEVAFDVVTVSERPKTSGGGTHEHARGAGRSIKGREERINGVFSGVVAAVARGPPTVRVDDGMLVFTDGAGQQQQALFGSWRLVPGSIPPGLGESVEFGLVKNTATGVFKATHIHLAQEAALAAATASANAALEGLASQAAAVDGVDSTQTETAHQLQASATSGRQLGRIALLKKEFGFIRQVCRPGDLFFHFSELIGIDPADAKVGDDVEYSVRRDRDRKMCAQAIRRAAPGAVAFDVISDTIIQGVVLEKPVVTKQYVQSSGVLEYETPVCDTNLNGGENSTSSAAGSLDTVTTATAMKKKKVRIVFAAGDCVNGAGALRPGDHVTFRIATNIAAAAAAAAAAQALVPGAAEMAGKRAVEVKPVVCHGVVAVVHSDRKFGFIVWPIGGGGGGGEGSVSVAAAAAAVEEEKEDEEAAAVVDSDAVSVVAEEGIPTEKTPLTITEEEVKEEKVKEESSRDTATAGDDSEEKETPIAVDVDEKQEIIVPTGDVHTPHVESTTTTTTTTTAPTSKWTAESTTTTKKQQQQQQHHRTFFHFSEVVGAVLLRAGDEVAFIMHTNLKNGELNACRVKRTRAAPITPDPPLPDATATTKTTKKKEKTSTTATPPPPIQNPNKLRLTGNLQSGEHKTQYKPVMPDGTKGFVFDRKKGLEVAAKDAPVGSPFTFFSGLPLKGVGPFFAACVSVQAKPFIPRSESLVSLKSEA